ncbi:CBO0543 family protein [Bacillus sp. RAR_GA_16]|uniref:CBO0543 family protein n=1 Tax=Bacillus sp. RAR_GA_16 TaxID=2876774 RepID=UPI001CCD96CB|nr:CBO0543 family protein [Bacillus sp. RAR_GA_16]MCA0174001.1 hypothetical protein [Bacillus sp. RAR_GA_16]
MDREKQFEHIVSLKKELESTTIEYWRQFSDYSTWQFWVILAMLIIPLIVLFLFIDRKKIFLLGFFGFSVHVLAAYLDALGVRKSWWDYPYIAIPQLPSSVSIDASFIPVYMIFLYQWCLNKEKNYWLYGSLSAIAFTFLFKPLLIGLHLFELYTNWFVLLAAYLFVIYAAKLLTDLFIKLSERA